MSSPASAVAVREERALTYAMTHPEGEPWARDEAVYLRLGRHLLIVRRWTDGTVSANLLDGETETFPIRFTVRGPGLLSAVSRLAAFRQGEEFIDALDLAHLVRVSSYVLSAPKHVRQEPRS